ncbi:nucleotidyltransferase domain-containing protein [Actinoplanes sp. LDG1-06]|uniref:Nucleotidyltransferase domain-containing protein n=1 Tax=Paractinoplanes ovalisporus TaxID=2810368 RepID=A0ABS2ASE1_9ACTN|nr:nucleotidyltransferase domain-containing protein [Actinoplanes ovalisporus]MBM2622800.1 nucleotidyltransferase domain-containing protein [Actinoplanes ovalisporus]
MDPIGDARALVDERFPRAVWAILTGSVLGPARTAGSDLDIVVLIPEGPGYRESLRFRGWPVELFVHTREALEGFLASEREKRKPSTHRMLATGVALRGDPSEWTARCAEVLAGGPEPLSEGERERLRYALTDSLDDYVHATDPGERTLIAAALWTETAKAALLLGGGWVSQGKWLLRELRGLDPALAERWVRVRESPEDLAREVLDRAGGPLFDGYRA